MATYVIETRNPEIETEWRRVGGAQKNRWNAEDDMHFFMDRNPGNQYRIVDTDARGTPAPPTSVPALPSRTNWRNHTFRVPPDGDYWQRFGETYPEVYAQIRRVIDHAGTSDADAKILHAAGGLLADLADWANRSKRAMRDRRAISFDALCYELADILGADEPPATNS